MASYTQNIDLQKLDPQDLFDEGVYNSNAEKIDKAIGGINSALGGTKIVRLSREDYDSTEHSADTVYYVTDQDGKVKQYLGDTEISGNSGGNGNAPSEAVVYCEPAPETVFAQVKGTNIDLSDPTLWEQGGINSDGSKWDSGNIDAAICTKELIPVTPTKAGLMFTSKIASGKSMQYAAVCYDENQAVTDSGMYDWFNSGTRKVLNDNVRYMRIETKTANWDKLTPADLTSAKIMILED